LTSNITVTVNDTTIPSSVDFGTLTETANANLSQSFIVVNISAVDNVNVDTISIFLFNSTDLLNNTNVTISGSTNSTGIINFTGLTTDGTYTFNATANDTAGNNNATGTGSRSVVLDDTKPVVTLTRDDVASSKTKISIDVAITDSTSGVTSTCGVTGGKTAATLTGTGTAQTLEEDGLNCASTYDFTVTCTDRAGNSVSKTNSFSTNGCSGSVGGGGAAATWSKTIISNDKELSEKGPITQNLGNNERVSVKVEGTTHHVGIKSVTATTATIEVSSTPQTVTFNIGEIKKFEVTDDDYFDLSVKLNSIENNKADITINGIRELMTPEEAEESEAMKEEGEEVPSEEPEQTTPEPKKSSNTIWIIIVVIIVVIVAVAIVAARKKK